MLFASDFRRKARESLSGKWLLAVGTGLVASILGATLGSDEIFDIDFRKTYDTFGEIRQSISFEGIAALMPFFYGALSLSLLWFLIKLIIGGVIKLGYSKFNIKLINRTNPEFDDLFSYFNVFGNAFLLNLLIALYTFLWSLLLIIPGIIAYYRYSMAFYIMSEDTSITATEAIERSKEMMYGNKWRLFCLDISFIGWAILASLTFGIGALWLNPYTEASRAAFYLELRGGNEEQQEYSF